MFTARRAFALAATALLMVSLSGCSLLTARGEDNSLTGTAACAQGHTWSLDTGDLSDQVVAALKATSNITATVATQGTQTFTWGVDGIVSVDSDYTITATVAPAADNVTLATSVHKGTATGKAYSNSDVGIPRNWDDSGFTVTNTFTLNGAPIPDPAPFAMPVTDFDDSVGLELTCDGSNLTTHPRGSAITQKWTRS